MFAAMYNNLELMEWLIDVKKVDINVDENGKSAITCAVARGHAEAVHMLLRRGANLPTATDPKKSLLYFGFASGSKKVVELLFEEGITFKSDEERRICIEASIGTWSHGFCRYAFSLFREINLSALEEVTQGLNYNEMELLAAALSNNNTVEVLDLSRTGLTDTVMAAIIQMLATNRHLATLRLKGNTFSLEACEELVASVRKHNRSLLDLDLDSEDLMPRSELQHTTMPFGLAFPPIRPLDSHGGMSGEEKEKRCRQMRQELADVLARNRQHRVKVARTAIQLLNTARLILQPPPMTQFDDVSPLSALPGELLEAIVKGVDAGDLLSDEERKRIMAFALDWERTTGKERHEFLRQCLLSLTFWPAPAPANDKDATVPNGQDKEGNDRQRGRSSGSATSLVHKMLRLFRS